MPPLTSDQSHGMNGPLLAVLHRLPVAVAAVGADLECLDTNTAAESLLLRSRGEIVGRHSSEFIHPDDLELVLESMQLIRDHPGRVMPVIVKLRRADGVAVPVELGVAIIEPEVEGVAYLVTMTPADVRVDIERFVEAVAHDDDLSVGFTAIIDAIESYRHYCASLHWSAGGVHLLAHDRRVQRLARDPRVAPLLQRAPSTNGDEHPLAALGIDAVEAGGLRSVVIHPLRVDGEPVGTLAAWLTHDLGMGPAGRRFVLRMAELASIAIGRRLLSERLHHQARTDPLTGLANRTEFLARADTLLRRTDARLALLDIDRFKQVNDEYGHAVGDEILIAVAERMRACIGGDDVVARLGGDEFAAVVVDDIGADRIRRAPTAPAQRHGARTAADKLRALSAMFTRPVGTLGGTFAVRASVGVVRGGQGTSVADLLAQADGRMYDDKRSRARHSLADVQTAPRLAGALVHS